MVPETADKPHLSLLVKIDHHVSTKYQIKRSLKGPIVQKVEITEADEFFQRFLCLEDFITLLA